MGAQSLCVTLLNTTSKNNGKVQKQFSRSDVSHLTMRYMYIPTELHQFLLSIFQLLYRHMQSGEHKYSDTHRV